LPQVTQQKKPNKREAMKIVAIAALLSLLSAHANVEIESNKIDEVEPAAEFEALNEEGRELQNRGSPYQYGAYQYPTIINYNGRRFVVPRNSGQFATPLGVQEEVEEVVEYPGFGKGSVAERVAVRYGGKKGGYGGGYGGKKGGYGVEEVVEYPGFGKGQGFVRPEPRVPVVRRPRKRYAGKKGGYGGKKGGWGGKKGGKKGGRRPKPTCFLSPFNPVIDKANGCNCGCNCCSYGEISAKTTLYCTCSCECGPLPPEPEPIPYYGGKKGGYGGKKGGPYYYGKEEYGGKKGGYGGKKGVIEPALPDYPYPGPLPGGGKKGGSEEVVKRPIRIKPEPEAGPPFLGGKKGGEYFVGDNSGSYEIKGPWY